MLLVSFAKTSIHELILNVIFFSSQAQLGHMKLFLFNNSFQCGASWGKCEDLENPLAESVPLPNSVNAIMYTFQYLKII